MRSNAKWVYFFVTTLFLFGGCGDDAFWGEGAGGVESGAAGTGGTSGDAGNRGEVPLNATCDDTLGWSPASASLEDDMLEIVNEHRTRGANCGGVSMPATQALRSDPALRCAARLHSRDMNERDFFDHTNPDGDGPGVRMAEAGWEGRGWGENIQSGSNTAEGAMSSLMSSPGHCRNIMDPDFTHAGIGVDGTKWTQVFAL